MRTREQAVAPNDASVALVPAVLADAATPAAPSASGPSSWPRVALDDAAPLCVFSSFKERGAAPFRKQAVKKQTLRAGESVVLGAYAPSECVNEQCDDVPTLQCWIEQQGDTLIVHSRYRARHKPDSHCSDNCREVTAGCATQPLAAGRYTLKHGDKSVPLKIPSVVRTPCLFRD